MDVSPCLLFEDIADSETDAAGPDHKIHADDDAHDDQDAESCSRGEACDDHHTPGFDEALDCDEKDSGASSGGDAGDDHHQCGRPCASCCLSSDHVALGCLPREEGEGEEEANMGEINKDDPSKKKEINKDEMEDGLFWETCMAVGYP